MARVECPDAAGFSSQSRQQARRGRQLWERVEKQAEKRRKRGDSAPAQPSLPLPEALIITVSPDGAVARFEARQYRAKTAQAERSQREKERLFKTWGVFSLLSAAEVQGQIRKQLTHIDQVEEIAVQAWLAQPDKAAKKLLKDVGIRDLPILLISPTPLPSFQIETITSDNHNLVILLKNESGYCFSQKFRLGSYPYAYFEAFNRQPIRIDSHQLLPDDSLSHNYLAFWFSQPDSFHPVPFEAVLTLTP